MPFTLSSMLFDLNVLQTIINLMLYDEVSIVVSNFMTKPNHEVTLFENPNFNYMEIHGNSIESLIIIF